MPSKMNIEIDATTAAQDFSCRPMAGLETKLWVTFNDALIQY